MENKPGPRNVGFYETSRQLQSRRVNHEIPRFQANNRSKGRVHVPAWWFEVDAYGAAVEGILMSIKHGLESPSIGVGQEVQILHELRILLEKLDPALKNED